MRKYETIFVIDSLLKSEEIENIISKYERFISANGGIIDVVEQWGKKRLAFEIKKRQYGYYVYIRFDGPPTMIKQLEREYRLNESLLRYKTLLMNKMAIKALTAKKLQTQKKSVEQKTQPPSRNIEKPKKDQADTVEKEKPAEEPVETTQSIENQAEKPSDSETDSPEPEQSAASPDEKTV
ncbi:30S ribosomal protein S6 [candidate division KSB1 bacterium]|nr:30S ribosomal protein S6 [candidate division KSB1 bacterium]